MVVVSDVPLVGSWTSAAIMESQVVPPMQMTYVYTCDPASLWCLYRGKDLGVCNVQESLLHYS